MNHFSVEDKSKVLRPPVGSSKDETGEEIQKEKTVDSAAYWRSPEYIEDAQVVNEVFGSVSARVKERIRIGYEEGKRLEAQELQEASMTQERMIEELSGASYLPYETIVDSKDPNINPTDFRYNVNNAVAGRKINEILQKNEREDGFFQKWVDDFGAVVLTEPWFYFGSHTGLTEEEAGTIQKYGRQIEAAKLSMAPREFETWFDKFIDEHSKRIGEEGHNTFFLQQVAAFSASKGYESEFSKVLNAGFTALEVVGAGQLIKAGAKGAITASKGVAAAKAARRAAREVEQEVLQTTERQSVQRTAESVTQMREGEDAVEALIRGNGVSNLEDTLGPAKKIVLDPDSVSEGSVRRSVALHYLDNVKTGNPVYDAAAAAVSDLVGVGDEAAKALSIRAAKVADEHIAAYSFPVYKEPRVVVASDGRAYAATHFGRNDGKAYLSKEWAQNRADKVGGSVVSTRLEDGKVGYVVQKIEPLDTGGINGVLDMVELEERTRRIAGLINFNSLRSSSNVSTSDTAAKFFIGEAGLQRVKAAVAPYVRRIQDLNQKDRKALDMVLDEQRMDQAASTRRFTEEEFKAAWQRKTGNRPTEAQVEAWEAAMDLEDASYRFKAIETYKGLLSEGYKSVTIENTGWASPGKKVSINKVDNDEVIWVANENRAVKVKDLTKEEKNKFSIMSVRDSFKAPSHDGEFFYIANPKVSDLSVTHVLGQRYGGRLDYHKARYFVTLGGGKRFSSAFSASSAKHAEEIKKGLEEVRRIMRDPEMTDDAKNVALARLDGKWHGGRFKDVATAKATAEAINWRDFEKVVAGTRKRDDVLVIDEAADSVVNISVGEAASNNHRSGNLVLHYGGNEPTHHAPVDSIITNAQKELFKATTNPAKEYAAERWVKAMHKYGLADEFGVGKSNNWVLELNSANLSAMAKKTSDPRVRALLTEATIIKRRIGEKGSAQAWMDSVAQTFGEEITNWSGGKFNPGGGDPTNALLAANFYTTFIVNPFQLVLQAFHAAAIIAIHPSLGTKGAAMSLMTRQLVKAENPAVTKAMANRMAKWLEMPEDEVLDMMEFYRSTGRGLIGRDIMEAGAGEVANATGAGYMRGARQALKEKGRKVADKGMFFFNEGEAYTQRTSLWTAILDFKKQHPNVKKLKGSQYAREWIAEKDNALTMGMTNISRSSFQDDWMKVPTQWLSYSLRMGEALFLPARGRAGLTMQQRLQLGAYIGTAYGMAGAGLSQIAPSAANQLANTFGIEPDSVAYTTFMYGVIDGVLDLAMPDGPDGEKIGLGLGKRMAPLGALFDSYEKLTGGKFLEVIAGPSYSVTGATLGALWELIGISTGRTTVGIDETLVKIMRTPSGVDNAWKGAQILAYGTYLSKTGTDIPYQFTTAEGIAQMLGVSPLRVQMYYDNRNLSRQNKVKLQEFRREINKRSTNAKAELARATTPQERLDAVDKLKYVVKEIQITSFSTKEKISLVRSVLKEGENDIIKLMKELMSQGEYEAALSLGGTLPHETQNGEQ